MLGELILNLLDKKFEKSRKKREQELEEHNKKIDKIYNDPIFDKATDAMFYINLVQIPNLKKRLKKAETEQEKREIAEQIIQARQKAEEYSKIAGEAEKRVREKYKSKRKKFKLF